MYTLVPDSVTTPTSRPIHYVLSFFLLLFALVTVTVLTGVANLPQSPSSPTSSASPATPGSSSSVYSASLIVSPSSSLISPYIAIIDAGSAGSRIYLYHYTWRDNRLQVKIATSAVPPSTPPSPIEKKLEPGLSYYASTGNYTGAAESVEPLLSFVLDRLPEQYTSTTPLFVYATAGLRLLPSTAQQATLDAVLSYVNQHYPFTFVPEHARVITGKEEGLFAWLALNYALGTLDGSGPTSSTGTAGLVELGGASVQVAMEMTPALLDSLGREGEAMLHPDYSQTVNLQLACPQAAPPLSTLYDDREHLNEDEEVPYSSTALSAAFDGPRTFKLYVTTYLGYGANSARKRYLNTLVATASSPSQPLVDPCLLAGSEEKLDGGDWVVRGSGEYERCRELLMPLLNKTVSCTIQPCSFNGVHQPVIDSSPDPPPNLLVPSSASSASTVSYMPFYGFSELFYTSLHLFNLTGLYSYSAFSTAAHAFCSQPWADVEKGWKNGVYGSVNEMRVRLQCFKAAWMSVVLHDGLGFRRGRTVDVEGVEVGAEKKTKAEAKRAGEVKDEKEVVVEVDDSQTPGEVEEQTHNRRLLQHDNDNSTATVDELTDPSDSSKPPSSSQDFGAPAQPSVSNALPPIDEPDDEEEPATSVSPASPPAATPVGVPSPPSVPPARLHSVSLTPISTMPSGEEVQWTLGAVLMQLSKRLVERPTSMCAAAGDGEQSNAQIAAEAEEQQNRLVERGEGGVIWFWRRLRGLGALVLLSLCLLSCVLLLCACSCMWWWERRRYLAGGDGSWKRNLRRNMSANHVINIRRW